MSERLIREELGQDIGPRQDSPRGADVVAALEAEIARLRAVRDVVGDFIRRGENRRTWRNLVKALAALDEEVGIMSERLSRERLEEALAECAVDNLAASDDLGAHIDALEAENERLRAAFKLCRSYVGTGNATADFEAAAEAFHRDTYMMAPGKSEPPGWNSRYTYDQRQMAWEAWLEKQTKDVRAALAALDEEATQ